MALQVFLPKKTYICREPHLLEDLQRLSEELHDAWALDEDIRSYDAEEYSMRIDAVLASLKEVPGDGSSA